MKKRTIALLSLLILLVGCMSTSKRMETALNLESAGQPEAALQHYMAVCSKHPDNVQAISGAARTGQIVIDKGVTQFKSSRDNNSHRQAVVHYDEAFKLYTQLKNLGVNTNWPTNLEAAISDSREKAILEYCEEEYQYGIGAMANKQYRKAYFHMANVIVKKPTYKDAAKRQAEALELGKQRITVMAGNNKKYATHSRQIQTEVMAYLMSLNDPFIEIVDRQHMATILQEQQLSYSGMMDEKSTVEAGRLAGISTIVYIEILAVQESRNNMKKASKKAFSITPILRDKGYKDTSGRFIPQYELTYSSRPITVSLYEKKAQLNITTNYQIISVETSQVLQAKNFTTTEISSTTYATCGHYDYRSLSTKVPNTELIRGTESVAVRKQNEAHKKFTPPYKAKYFNAPREIMTSANLKQVGMAKVGKQVGEELFQFFTNK